MAILTLDKAKPRLRRLYQDRRLIPFLGAGFSAPLRLPQWSALMDMMGASLGFDPKVYELHGLPPQLAGFYAVEHGGSLAPFVSEMEKAFHNPTIDARRRTSAQHEALAKLNFRRIYTTNFEHHIENALREKGKRVQHLVRPEDFMHPVRDGVCQVVKFHGDLAYPDTVVLTETQYFDRMRLEAAPDQCLRADLLSNVFLFLGYSFNDTNIRYIWHRRERLLRESGASPRAEDQRSYWATFGYGMIQPKLLEAWHIDVIALDPCDKSKSVAELLDAIGS